jgi:hypothetical protein
MVLRTNEMVHSGASHSFASEGRVKSDTLKITEQPRKKPGTERWLFTIHFGLRTATDVQGMS